jgi:hypothetical protein
MNKYEIELQELLTFFEGARFPDLPFKLNKYMTLVGVDKFIEGEVNQIRGYKGSDVVHDSLLRHLRELKEVVLNHTSVVPE